MNDWIRQTISSSAISLWNIFVTPTTSAPALISRTSMRVCTFRIFLELPAVIRFLTLKRLQTSAITAELKLVYEIEAAALSTMKKWRQRFAEGRTSVCDGPSIENPLPTTEPKAFPVC
jgi:hypothetical protein